MPSLLEETTAGLEGVTQDDYTWLKLMMKSSMDERVGVSAC